MKKRWVAACMAAVLALGCLAGCKAGQGSAADAQPGAAQSGSAQAGASAQGAAGQSASNAAQSTSGAAAASFPADPAAAAHTPQAIQTRGTLLAAVWTDDAPYAFSRRDGQLAGDDIAVAGLLADVLGVQLRVVPCADAASAAAAVTAGEADICFAGTAFAQSAPAGVQLCTAPYAGGAQCFVLRREDVQYYQSLADLTGKSISCQMDEKQKALLEELLPISQISRSTTVSRGLRRLRAGASAAVLMSTIEAAYYVGTYPDLGLCAVAVEGSTMPAAAVPAVAAGNDALREKADALFTADAASGALGGAFAGAQDMAQALMLLA